MKKKGPERRDANATRASLLAAARAAFLRVGYERTDTNRISRAAGFSPQTFYRHFADKRAAFLEVYRAWVKRGVFGVIEARTVEAAARRLVREHERMRVFRRTLRMLAVTDEEVRRVRAEQREAQVRAVRERWLARARVDDADLYAWLLSIERWVDALVDGELGDLGVTRARAIERLASMLDPEALTARRAARSRRRSKRPPAASPKAKRRVTSRSARPRRL